jgi:hypothetical protein
MKLHLYIMWVMYLLASITMLITIAFTMEGDSLGVSIGLAETTCFTIIGCLAEHTYKKSINNK